jgi:hypothetical protein
MKLLLLLIITCLVSVTANAQTESIDLKKFRENAHYRETLRQRSKTKAFPSDSTILFLNRSVFSGNLKPDVHRLPQDGMPCVVPDTKDIAAIPNVFKRKLSIPFTGNPPRIPNPYQTKPF